MNEDWKAIPGFEQLYECSNKGRIRSLDREVAIGKNRRIIKSRIMKHCINRTGYHLVSLCSKNERKWHAVSVLVALLFIGPRPDGYQVCHNDGNKDNNSVTNLRYDTPKNNCADRKLHGTEARGESQGLSKLKKEDISIIKEMTEVQGLSDADIATKFGITKGTLSNLILGNTWKHLGITFKRKKPFRKLTSQKAANIKWLLNNSDLSIGDISTKYGCSKKLIYGIKAGTAWSNVFEEEPIND